MKNYVKFDEWLEKNPPFGGEYLHEYAKQAWDARQQEIDSLKAKIEKLEKRECVDCAHDGGIECYYCDNRKLCHWKLRE